MELDAVSDVIMLDCAEEPEGMPEDGSFMQDMKQLAEYVKEHPVVIVATALGAVVGAVLGAIAFYRHWLG